MIAATIASVLALLVIVGFLVWSIIRFGQAAERAEARLMVQEELLDKLDAQGVRIEGQADTIRRLNELLVELSEDQLVLLDKIDVQTETIEELVTEIETLTRDTLVEVTDLHFELVEVPGEPGRIEIVREPELVKVPAPPLPPDDPEPEPEPEPPGRDCDQMPPPSNRQHCQ